MGLIKEEQWFSVLEDLILNGDFYQQEMAIVVAKTVDFKNDTITKKKLNFLLEFAISHCANSKLIIFLLELGASPMAISKIGGISEDLFYCSVLMDVERQPYDEVSWRLAQKAFLLSSSDVRLKRIKKGLFVVIDNVRNHFSLESIGKYSSSGDVEKDNLDCVICADLEYLKDYVGSLRLEFCSKRLT